MVRDGKLSAEEYIDLFVSAIPLETSDEIVSSQFSFVSVALNVMTPRKFQNQLADNLFDFSVKYLASVDKSLQNRIVSVKAKLLDFAKSDEAVK